MESEVDSRLVSHQDGKWQVSHGPFESYDHLGETNWSLLVQAVNHWHEPTAALMRPFRELPDWRIDDLMISFSVPGGGVGPHLDQYDVFIIQGTGRRRWRVGEKLQMKQHCPHPDLLQVDPFEAIIDEELEPGDILYIPPGFPHEGYALENAMNYSVGFRAPNTRELISGFADFAPPEPPYQPDEIYDALKQGDVLVRLGGLRVLRIGDDVYANGEKIDSPHRPALDALASNIALTAENFGDALEDPSFLAMLAALVNSGYWFFEG